MRLRAIAPALRMIHKIISTKPLFFNAVIEYLKNVNKIKKFLIFHQKLNSLFGNTLFSDENLL